jgi:hypothetical protein
LRFDVWYAGLLSHAGSQRHEAEERNQSPHWHVEESIVLTQIMSASSATLTLPDCVRVARFYRELSYAPNQGLGE